MKRSATQHGSRKAAAMILMAVVAGQTAPSTAIAQAVSAGTSVEQGLPVDPVYTAMAQLALGDPVAACATLDAAYPDERDNVDVLLIRARCLFQTAQFDESIENYERLAEIQGSAFIVHYELAQAYLAVGQNAPARRTLQRVLDLSPPALVGDSVARQMQILDPGLRVTGRKAWSAELRVGRTFDTNINGGPSSSTFEAFGLPFTVAPGAMPKQAEGNRIAALAQFYHRLTQDTGILMWANASTTQYVGTDLDNSSLSVNAAPVFRFDDVTLSIGPSLNIQWFDKRERRVFMGPVARLAKQFPNDVILSLDGSYFWSRFQSNKARDSETWILTPSVEVPLTAKLGAAVGYRVSVERADDHTYSNVSHGPALSFRYLLSTELTLTGAYQYQRIGYKETASAFATPRRDYLNTVALGAVYDISQYTVDGMHIRADYIYRDNRSSIPLFEVDRNTFEVALAYKF